jgi:uncharacterized protein YukE
MSHSADPDALESFGRTMKDQMLKIDQLMKDVDGPLNSIVWTGPAKDRFKSEWETSFKGALGKLNVALDAAGLDCQNRAQGVRQVLGVGG